jgi:hypothetical protein
VNRRCPDSHLFSDGGRRSFKDPGELNSLFISVVFLEIIEIVQVLKPSSYFRILHVTLRKYESSKFQSFYKLSIPLPDLISHGRYKLRIQ